MATSISPLRPHRWRVVQAGLLLLGGGVKGGKVYGRWPGLDSSHLYGNIDLAVTTDFRDVFAEILEKRIGIANLKPVFPGYELSGKKRLGLIAGRSFGPVPDVLQTLDMSSVSRAAGGIPSSAVERAEAFGLDLTHLIENLRRTPTERLRWAERTLHSVVAFQEEARRAPRPGSKR